MPFGDFVNNIPSVGFLAIHFAAFAVGAYFAWRSFGGRGQLSALIRSALSCGAGSAG